MQSIGPYTLHEEVGRGAMGVVFRGFDPAIGRPVAVKVIRVDRLAPASEIAELQVRFAREAAAIGRLSHANIVTLYQVGEQDDVRYLVFEFVQGSSLEQVLSTGEPQDPKMALSVLSQMADALDYAHKEGVIHRDVKPANILVCPDGKCKLTDFGIARLPAQSITRTGFTMGTPAHMAPEQIMAGRVNGRADQFSLAIIAYQMLCGRKPFVSDNEATLLFQIVQEEPPAMHEVNGSLSHAASDVVRKAMSKNPDHRFPTCSEFIKKLSATLIEAGPVETRVAAPPIPVGRRYRSLGALVALLFVVVGLLVFASRSPSNNVRYSGLVLRALSAYRTQNYSAAFPLFRQAAESGDAGAMNWVALMYWAGSGVPQNYGESLKWRRKAAAAGNSAAMVELGDLCASGKGVPQDYGEAMTWYRKAAEVRNPSGMYALGRFYELGLGVKADKNEAISWYRKAGGLGKDDLRRLGAAP